MGMKKKLLRGLLIMFILFSVVDIAAANMVVNGDFSAGKDGFHN
ncbi:MAG: hypothetical protein A4E66_02629 [Syntrophus sp. PtaB.Bin001]|nr:MAG: hypothetical protein A4E66_02629 [Syntrophus sp. PtaB.Bin001]